MYHMLNRNIEKEFDSKKEAEVFKKEIRSKYLNSNSYYLEKLKIKIIKSGGRFKVIWKYNKRKYPI